MGNRTMLVMIAMIPIAGLVAWLVTKIARTPEGNYRLLVIAGAILIVMILVAIPAGVQRLRR